MYRGVAQFEIYFFFDISYLVWYYHILKGASYQEAKFCKITTPPTYSKLYKELKNSIKIKVGQRVLELLIQKQHFDCFLIYNIKITWPTKISMPFLSSLNNFL